MMTNTPKKPNGTLYAGGEGGLESAGTEGSSVHRKFSMSSRANRPGACGQFDHSLGVCRKRSSQALTNRHLYFLISRRQIVRCRALPGKERFPVVVKAGETRRYFE